MVMKHQINILRRLELIYLMNTLGKGRQGQRLATLNKKLRELGEERDYLALKKQRLEETISCAWSLTASAAQAHREAHREVDSEVGTIRRAMYFSKDCTWLSEVTKHCLDELGVAAHRLSNDKDLAVLRYQQCKDRGEMLNKRMHLLRAHLVQARESLESLELEEQSAASLASLA